MDCHITESTRLRLDLAADRESLPGTVKFIFQPAEESAEGASAMIKDGVLEGPAMSGIDLINITLSGSSIRGSLPTKRPFL